ncbi:MAG: hypothetical protein QOJ85_791, partial [Solirubrobacteraceae bacterium]|nr:hypothetical protein [Solirubrobacteraceae bacterium]
ATAGCVAAIVRGERCRRRATGYEATNPKFFR